MPQNVEELTFCASIKGNNSSKVESPRYNKIMCSCLSYGNGNFLKAEHVLKEFVLFLIVD